MRHTYVIFLYISVYFCIFLHISVHFYKLIYISIIIEYTLYIYIYLRVCMFCIYGFWVNKNWHFLDEACHYVSCTSIYVDLDFIEKERQVVLKFNSKLQFSVT